MSDMEFITVMLSRNSDLQKVLRVREPRIGLCAHHSIGFLPGLGLEAIHGGQHRPRCRTRVFAHVVIE